HPHLLAGYGLRSGHRRQICECCRQCRDTSATCDLSCHSILPGDRFMSVHVHSSTATFFLTAPPPSESPLLKGGENSSPPRGRGRRAAAGVAWERHIVSRRSGTKKCWFGRPRSSSHTPQYVQQVRRRTAQDCELSSREAQAGIARRALALCVRSSDLGY